MAMKLKTKNDGKNQMIFPLPDVPNVEVVLRHFHRHCYKNSPLWFFVRRGLWPLDC
jgi:hypothetical protein